MSETQKAPILLVEDDSFLSQVLGDRLTQEGYDVTICGDGEEGLKTAKKEMHDLVLLDIVLPTLDGISILREIKADDRLTSMNVIMLSNLNDPKRVQEASDLGAEYYVKSDTELEEIVKTVQKKLGTDES
jgi:DNA-binding response OmpR family regulator